MKQLISMPSTKPQQFLYTDFSVVSCIDHPKHRLARIINYIKNVLKMRIYLCYRDVEQLYRNDEVLFNRYLYVGTCEEMWRKLSKKNGETLQEREIVGLLTKIVIAMTKQKNQAAQTKNYQQFTQLKSTIQYLQTKILQLQTTLRDRIKQQAIRKHNEQQTRRQKHFKQEAQQIKTQLQINLYKFQKQLNKKHQQENNIVSNAMNLKIQKEGYLYKPSKFLMEAKEEALLAKLAPFKREKKRVYQCRVLQDKLADTIDKAKQKTQRQIQQYKYYQSQRIKRRHQIQHTSYLSRLQNKNSQTLARLKQKSTQLNKSQHIKMQKLLSQNNKLTNQRISSLQKSLNHYSMHDQSKQIRNVMRSHREIVQFSNNVEEVGDTAVHGNTVGFCVGRYGTVDVESEWTKRKKLDRYSQERVESKILRKVKNQTILDKYGDQLDKQLQPSRKSLVDLYDKDLNQV